MAVKKSASASKAKAQDAPAPKTKAAGVKSASAAKKETAPKTTSTTSKTAAPKAAAAKPAAPKKAPAPAAKLTSTQTELLGRVHGAGEPGYLSTKKGEQRTLDALRERKLIKRGAKHKESGEYHYQVSTAGKKHVDSNPAAPAAGNTASSPSGGTA